jgi:hypothetical protein
MAQQNNENFHPRLVITDHFDALVNQIDIKTETLLESENLTEEKRNELNEMRERQIEKIKEIEEINFNSLPQKIDENEYTLKWSHILNSTSLKYQEKLDQIKEELIKFDCILLEQPNINNGLDLWVTAWYYNQKNLEFLK